MKRLLILALFASPTFAATHWVSPTGSAVWSSCVGATPLSGTSACSLSTALSNAASGDLVYLRAGTYTTSGGLAPSNSGNGSSLPSSYITFQAYTGETPNIAPTSGSDNYLNLTGLSYIKISGLTFTNSNNQVGRLEAGANHNEITGCTFNSPNGWNINFLIDGTGSNTWSTHNWIHGNTFSTSGQAHGDGGTGCTDGGGDTMDIGAAYGVYNTTSDLDNYNTVENNIFSHAPHTTFETFGEYTVFRNNVIHNEPWSSGCASHTNSSTYNAGSIFASLDGDFGHRNVTFDNDYTARTFTHTLIEGNRSGYGGVNDANDGAEDFTLGGAQDIFRYNYAYGSMNPGVIFKWDGWGSANGSGGHVGYSRVFNNTFYDNGIGYTWGYTCILSTCPWPETGLSLYSGSDSAVGMVFKNNLMYEPDSLGWQHWGGDALEKSIGGTYPGPFTAASAFADFAAGNAANNWCTGTQTVPGGAAGACSAYGNPTFNNPTLGTFTSTTLPDLSLQASSGALNGGTYLTTATNSGAGSTSLTVADALYFQDGTWGSSLARASAGLGGTMQADCISIGTVGNHVCISAVSYGTYNSPAGTITLASPATWSNGASVWLYSDSSGTVRIQSTAPNYGAGMQTSGGPSAPTNLQGVVMQGVTVQ